MASDHAYLPPKTSDSVSQVRSRLSHRFRERLVRPNPISATRVWLVYTFIGFVFGLVESIVHLVWTKFGPRVGDPNLWINWHKPWLAPISMALYAFAFGIVVSLPSHVLPRVIGRLGPLMLVAFGSWSVIHVIPGLNGWAISLLVTGLAVRLGPYVHSILMQERHVARRVLPMLLCIWLMLMIFAGVIPSVERYWSAMGPEPQTDRPNVLLVVLDTVRADHLSLYGYPRATSPNLEKLAHRGVRFDNARSTTSFTLGTHTSLFTGYYMSQTTAGVNSPLGSERRTLAEELRDEGYATGGFVGNIFYGSEHYGLNRGFVHYYDNPGDILRKVTLRELLRSTEIGEFVVNWFERRNRIMQPMQRMRLEGDEINRETLAWIDKHVGKRHSFFAFVNYFDAHSPYSLPGHASQPFARRTAEVLEAKMKQLERLEAKFDEMPDASLETELERLRPEVYALLTDHYDDGISYIDRKLSELLDGLEDRGMLDNTLVVVTSDHGEMLGEHSRIGHGNSLDRQVIHVPLLVIGPERMGLPMGKSVDVPVSVRDVPRTILELVGSREQTRFPGKSLSRYWAESDPKKDDPVVLSEVEYMPWVPHNERMPVAFGPMIVLSDKQYSYHRQQHETLGLVEKLFDTIADPDENHNLAQMTEYSELLIELRQRFEREYERISADYPTARATVHSVGPRSVPTQGRGAGW